MEKLKKYLTISLWLSVLVLLVFNATRGTEINEDMFDAYNSFDSFEKLTTNPLVYSVSDEGQPIGYLAFGSEYGYQSDILVGSVINLEGSVVEVVILDQNETPSFIEKINNHDFLATQFPGIAIEEGFDTTTNIRVVSGASVSSKAITQAVLEASQVIGETYLGVDVPVSTTFVFGVMEVVLLGMLLLAFLSYKLHNKALRYLTLAYSVILLGFKYKKFIAYSWIVSLFTGQVPAFASNVGWYILIGGTVLFIALTGKNLYCAYICPFGSLQRAEKTLSGFNFFKVNPLLKKWLRFVPVTLAYTGFVVAVLTEQMGTLSYEPFSLLYGRTGAGIQWVLLPIVLIMSLFVMGYYCHSICPIGFVLKQGVKLRSKVMDITGLKKKPVKVAHTNKASQKMTFKMADIIMLMAVVVTAGVSLLTIFSNV